MMKRYKSNIRSNMRSAESDYNSSPEHQRGFVIGGVGKLWEVYNTKHQITEQQFDQLILVLSEYMQGKYKDFIEDLVRQYKSGNPPIVIGY